MPNHPFDILPLPNGSTFIFTPCPGTKVQNLADSLSTLKKAGADAVVTMLPDTEITILDVARLGQETENAGMQWFQLPVEDDCAPEAVFTVAFQQAKDSLLALIAKKATIAIHCKGGSGRTGLMAAVLLLESGMQWNDVKTLVQSIRPNALTLPVHLEYLQKHYVL
ncbi:dual specificity protein phosphatase family protein [Endozoicomonas acroporae]|uniref:phosphatase domain-containing putative toxin n=1 Tax=Endozoicomonas acroporae TaxID=1701104 RepID=UPI0013D88D9D|nr:dual specificity protein phosphatase family protein [Endozoicomonas acroporae]